jgi:hypothetical protein
MAVDSKMTAAALNRAKEHVYNVTQLGMDYTLVKASVKDELGGVLSESTVTFKSFPNRWTPYDRKTTRQISWTDDTDFIGYLSRKEIEDAGYTVDKLRKEYKKLRIAGKTYEITHVEPYSAFGTSSLYIIVGGKV